MSVCQNGATVDHAVWTFFPWWFELVNSFLHFSTFGQTYVATRKWRCPHYLGCTELERDTLQSDKWKQEGKVGIIAMRGKRPNVHFSGVQRGWHCLHCNDRIAGARYRETLNYHTITNDQGRSVTFKRVGCMRRDYFPACDITSVPRRRFFGVESSEFF